MFKFNSSHLNNAVMLKILKASRICLSAKRPVLIKNRKGQFFLKVTMTLIGGCYHFIITDLLGNNIDNSIINNYYTNANKGMIKLILNRIA